MGSERESGCYQAPGGATCSTRLGSDSGVLIGRTYRRRRRPTLSIVLGSSRLALRPRGGSMNTRPRRTLRRRPALSTRERPTDRSYSSCPPRWIEAAPKRTKKERADDWACERSRKSRTTRESLIVTRGRHGVTQIRIGPMRFVGVVRSGYSTSAPTSLTPSAPIPNR